jgi:arylformamidase
MTGGIIDISVQLDARTPVWPDSDGFRTVRTRSLEMGDPANVTRLECDVHVGTHIDAPRHFLRDGATVEMLPLEMLIGPATVADLPRCPLVTAALLESLALPRDTRRLLMRTGNSRLWKEPCFQTGYTALSPDAARWIVDRGIGLIGIDYLSVERYGTGPDAHTILLEADVVILEGLDLTDAPAGKYELICLPLRLAGAEGAPARAVLRSCGTTKTEAP